MQWHQFRYFLTAQGSDTFWCSTPSGDLISVPTHPPSLPAEAPDLPWLGRVPLLHHIGIGSSWARQVTRSFGSAISPSGWPGQNLSGVATWCARSQCHLLKFDLTAKSVRRGCWVKFQRFCNPTAGGTPWAAAILILHRTTASVVRPTLALCWLILGVDFPHAE